MSDFTPLSALLEKLGTTHKIDVSMTPLEREQKKVDYYNQEVGNLNEQDGYNCSICKNKGWVAWVGSNGVEAHDPCKCQTIRATLNRAKRSGLGAIITEFTFDKYKASEDWQKTIKNTAQAFCKDENAKWFYIGGQVGCGKTHICTAIAAHYIKAGKEVKYMLWCEESKDLKAIANDISYRDRMDEYNNVDVLYIDDFLKTQNGEEPTPADIKLGFEIINHRLLENNKITIISSEKLLDELMDYDEATMSRIYQKTGNYKFNISKDRSKNYRLKDLNK